MKMHFDSVPEAIVSSSSILDFLRLGRNAQKLCYQHEEAIEVHRQVPCKAKESCFGHLQKV
jgi:hypothetical protein